MKACAASAGAAPQGKGLRVLPGGSPAVGLPAPEPPPRPRRTPPVGLNFDGRLQLEPGSVAYAEGFRS